MLHLVRQVDIFDQRLARYASVVQAVTAHFVGLNQGHFRLDSRRNIGRHQTTSTRANLHQVAIQLARPHRCPAGIDLVLFDDFNQLAWLCAARPSSKMAA